jgi:hypothetical protein
VLAAGLSNSRTMRLLDSAIRRATRLSIRCAGSLILEVQRREGRKPRRTPDHLLIEGGSGLPGPALVEPAADLDRVSMPSEVDRTQVKELAAAAGRAALGGAVKHLSEAARQLPGNLRAIPPALAAGRQGGRGEADDEASAPPAQPGERAAWDRFLTAYERLAELRILYEVSPDDRVAEHLRSAELELGDAVAVAGEFEVHQIRWILA